MHGTGPVLCCAAIIESSGISRAGPGAFIAKPTSMGTASHQRAGGCAATARRWSLLWALLFIGAVSAGCGADPSGPETGEVTGVVTYLGKPVANANIIFLPREKGTPAAAGVTDAAGKYQLSISGAKRGAVVGAYQVSITLRDAYGGPIPAGMSELYAQEIFQNLGKPLIPEKYFLVATSNLSAEVDAGDNSFDFALHD